VNDFLHRQDADMQANAFFKDLLGVIFWNGWTILRILMIFLVKGGEEVLIPINKLLLAFVGVPDMFDYC